MTREEELREKIAEAIRLSGPIYALEPAIEAILAIIARERDWPLSALRYGNR